MASETLKCSVSRRIRDWNDLYIWKILDGWLWQSSDQPRRLMEVNKGEQDDCGTNAGVSSGLFQLLVWHDVPGTVTLWVYLLWQNEWLWSLNFCRVTTNEHLPTFPSVNKCEKAALPFPWCTQRSWWTCGKKQLDCWLFTLHIQTTHGRLMTS